MEKRLAEIRERKSQIMNELKEADADKLQTLNNETDALNKEEQEVRSRMDLSGKLKSPEAQVTKDEIEERAKEFSRTGRLSISATEARSTLISGGKIATPTAVGGISEPQNILSSIVDMITVEDLTGTGGYKEAYMTAWQSAGAGSEGSAANTSDPTFKVAAINPFDIDVMSYIGKQVRKQSPLQYEAKVRQGALIALKKKVVSYIIGGDGATEPFGIYNAANTDPAAICEAYEVTANTIDATTLRKIVFAYGGDENIGAGARLFLNKKDLIKFGDVRGSNEKKAVYEITPDGSNPNIGIIKDGGLSVPYVICSDVTALSESTYTVADIPTMIYGNPANYKLGLFGDFEVAVSDDYKFGEGLLTIRGEVLVGGNVVADKGFLVVTLTNA